MKISEILQSLVGMIFSLLITVGAFWVLFKFYESNNMDLSQNDDTMLYLIIPIMCTYMILLYSIYKLANSLEKNGAGWAFASLAISPVVFIAIPYFTLLALFQIIVLSFRNKSHLVVPATDSIQKIEVQLDHQTAKLVRDALYSLGDCQAEGSSFPIFNRADSERLGIFLRDLDRRLGGPGRMA